MTYPGQRRSPDRQWSPLRGLITALAVCTVFWTVSILIVKVIF